MNMFKVRKNSGGGIMRTFDKPREKRQPRSTDHGPRTNQPTTDFYPVSPHPRVNNALTPRRIPTNFATPPLANFGVVNNLQTRGEAKFTEYRLTKKKKKFS
jgi:hypothetical protein